MKLKMQSLFFIKMSNVEFKERLYQIQRIIFKFQTIIFKIQTFSYHFKHVVCLLKFFKFKYFSFGLGYFTE